MEPKTSFTENRFEALSGWLVLIGIFLTELTVIAHSVWWAHPAHDPARFALVLVFGVLLLPFTLPGFFVVSPNMSRVLTLFGKYRGTERRQGFY